MEQTNLTPEQYKTLAEFAGHKTYCGGCLWPLKNTQEEGCMASDCSMRPVLYPETAKVVYIKDANQFKIPYTPDTNDSQAMELLRKWLTEIEDTLPRQQYMNKVLRLMGKLDNLSICYEVLALMEEQK